MRADLQVKFAQSVDGPRRNDPLATLSRYLSNFVEVLVVVEDDEARLFRCRCDQEVGNLAATLASIGDEDLAYANAVEILREETPAGFVPNYARPGGWKSFDRSEPPVGAITVLDLYKKFHDRWFLQETYEPLLKWNRWWTEHRDLEGFITLGSDPENKPAANFSSVIVPATSMECASTPKPRYGCRVQYFKLWRDS